ncbi:MAG: hypothetical protein AB4041_05605 [Microcystaceae cyanobacterium]
MKPLTKLPDEKTLDQLIEIAENTEMKAKALCDLATEIDEKWRKRLESRRKKQIEEMSKSS